MKTDKKGLLAIIIVAFCFAVMGLFARFLNNSYEIFQQIYLRLFVAIFLGLIIFKKDLNFKKLKKISLNEWLLLMARAVLIYLIGVALFVKAVNITKIANVSFIGALPLTALWGFLLFKEKFTFKKVFLITAAFLGVILLTVKDFSNLSIIGLGEIYALIHVVFFSLGHVTRKLHSNILNDKELSIIIFIFAFIFIFITSLIIGEGLPVIVPSSLPVIFIAGFFNLIIIYLSNYGFKRVHVVLASNLISLESFFALVIGFVFFLEIPILTEIIGGLIVVISAYFMSLVDKKEK
ncbi:DMT family transporter [archaeon]|jgi:drug/metabolite transporter (DMT)-like permease|nr:DMT family transporter [archaeon]MBT4022760.1 DMT family transporter [archaeon]MBT4273046.1 DMT family transporter [archaeon]MBT4461027.1 DMT family transporter [archaeon]MBT4858079.1 DMT family transporter [archaeon]